NADGFDMIILPGGQPGTDNLKADNRIKPLLNDFNSAGKMIGAICAATTILAEAGLLQGRRATSYPSCKEQMSGANYENKPVVTDGNIITSQGPATAVAFALTIVSRLAGRHLAEETGKAMLASDSLQQGDIWDKRLFNSTIQALVGALELNDSFTQGHAKRVCEYCLSIGAKLGLSETELRDLYLGAVLHDIGKIGTVEDLLNKPERLNSREEILIREHPLKGTLFIVGNDSLS